MENLATRHTDAYIPEPPIKPALLYAWELLLDDYSQVATDDNQPQLADECDNGNAFFSLMRAKLERDAILSPEDINLCRFTMKHFFKLISLNEDTTTNKRYKAFIRLAELERNYTNKNPKTH